MTYDIARKQFSAFGAPVSAAEVKEKLGYPACVRLVGWRTERHASAFGIAPQLLTLVAHSGHGADGIAVYDYRPFGAPGEAP